MSTYNQDLQNVLNFLNNPIKGEHSIEVLKKVAEEVAYGGGEGELEKALDPFFAEGEWELSQSEFWFTLSKGDSTLHLWFDGIDPLNREKETSSELTQQPKETTMTNTNQNTQQSTQRETSMSDFTLKGYLSAETLSLLREDSAILAKQKQKTLKSFDAHPGLQSVLGKLPGSLNRITVMYKEAGTRLDTPVSLEGIKEIDKESPLAIALLGKEAELIVNGVKLENTKLGVAPSVMGLTLDSYLVPLHSKGAWIIVFWKHKDQDFVKAPGVNVGLFQPVALVINKKATELSEATQKYLANLKSEVKTPEVREEAPVKKPRHPSFKTFSLEEFKGLEDSEHYETIQELVERINDVSKDKKAYKALLNELESYKELAQKELKEEQDRKEREVEPDLSDLERVSIKKTSKEWIKTHIKGDLVKEALKLKHKFETTSINDRDVKVSIKERWVEILEASLKEEGNTQDEVKEDSAKISQISPSTQTSSLIEVEVFSPSTGEISKVSLTFQGGRYYGPNSELGFNDTYDCVKANWGKTLEVVETIKESSSTPSASVSKGSSKKSRRSSLTSAILGFKKGSRS